MSTTYWVKVSALLGALLLAVLTMGGGVVMQPAAAVVPFTSPAVAEELDPCDAAPVLLRTGCKVTNVGVDGVKGAVGDATEAAVNAAAESGASKLAEVFMGAWDGVMKQFLTSWLDSGLLVDLEGSQVTWLTDSLGVITVGLAVIGIMLACGWTVVHTRGDRLQQVVDGLFRVLLVSTIGTALMAILIPAGDEFAKWIVDEAGVTVSGWTSLATASIVATNPGLALIAGFLGVLATAFQWLIMLIRAILLPLLIGFWPTAAAATMIRGGEQSFATLTKWIIAFLIYKPVAAVVYAFAWKLKSSDDLSAVINGLGLIVLAIFALPALLKLLAPATSALGSASGGSMALVAGGAVVTAGVAAGAAVVTGGGSTAAMSAGGAKGAGGGAASGGGGGGAVGGVGGGSGSPATAAGASPTQAISPPPSAGGEDSAETAPGSAAPSASNAGGTGPGSTGAGSAPAGASPGESSGPPSAAGGAGGSGTAPPSGGAGAAEPSSGTSASGSGASGSGVSGLGAAAQSVGGTVAQGAARSDGDGMAGGTIGDGTTDGASGDIGSGGETR